MNRKDSKRKSRLDLSNQTLSSNGVFITIKGRPRRSRRRMTCPSPAEINKAMVAVTLAPLGKGCTLEELLEKCIQSFDLEGNLWRNEDTVHMTLVMHSWVVPSDEFAQKLLQLYPSQCMGLKHITLINPNICDQWPDDTRGARSIGQMLYVELGLLAKSCLWS
ncbi:RAS guanyl-releasing 4 [Pelobates cultripes]|uniref:RAS guanyl-releasing 4 n=1 Tax=Pelobates cultripes TaxID=61616 RepID=A0AAD1WHX5_PELCU|nr:RAS guanyl-releasing 4 [Pelobates cultripes]